MSQIDVTTGNGAAQFESVRPDGNIRTATRITPQTVDQGRPADPVSKVRPHMLTDDYRAPAASAASVASGAPGLDPQDIAALHAALTKGPDGLARKRDLGDMHRQTVKLFQTLNDGLGDQQRAKAAEDRAVLIARMERLEKSVNSMEGAVRIEMAPLLRSMLTEALAAQAAPQRPRYRRGLWGMFALAIGLLVGVTFADDIAPAAKSVADQASQTAARMVGR